MVVVAVIVMVVVVVMIMMVMVMVVVVIMVMMVVVVMVMVVMEVVVMVAEKTFDTKNDSNFLAAKNKNGALLLTQSKKMACLPICAS